MLDLHRSKIFELTKCKTSENLFAEDAKLINAQVFKNMQTAENNQHEVMDYNSESEYLSEGFDALIRQWKRDSELTDSKVNSLIFKQSFYKKKLPRYRYINLIKKKH